MPSNATVISQIEDMSGWDWCTRTTPDGQECAGGVGDATSWKADNQSSPSHDGSSAKFNLGGSTGYSNALWWKELTPNPSFSHFNYDLWFYMDNPDAPQALEFDVNQVFGGNRFVFGTECNFKERGVWDLWDGTAGHWVPSNVPCKVFSPNTWHHLIWQFERSDDHVHYVSLTIDGQTTSVDVWHPFQAGVGGNGIDIAFQMDGDENQTSYNVWLDQVTLSQW